MIKYIRYSVRYRPQHRSFLVFLCILQNKRLLESNAPKLWTCTLHLRTLFVIPTPQLQNPNISNGNYTNRRSIIRNLVY